MTVIRSNTALYASLKFLSEGTRLTVHTDNQGQARTNVVAELRKEPNNGGFHDWQVLRRPVSADASLLPSTFTGEQPELLSNRALADALDANPDLWIHVDD